MVGLRTLKKASAGYGARSWPGRGMVVEMNDGWMELTLAGEFWQVNLCQALIDYFAVVIEKRPASPGMMDLGD